MVSVFLFLFSPPFCALFSLWLDLPKGELDLGKGESMNELRSNRAANRKRSSLDGDDRRSSLPRPVENGGTGEDSEDSDSFSGVSAAGRRGSRRGSKPPQAPPKSRMSLTVMEGISNVKAQRFHVTCSIESNKRLLVTTGNQTKRQEHFDKL